MPTRKIDLVARHRSEYAATRAPRLITAGPGRYLALAGRGEPEGEAFQRQAAALHAVALGVRAATRRRGKDFRMPPLEALWWSPRPLEAAPGALDQEWNWKLLLRVPNFVISRDLRPVAEALVERGLAEAGEVRREELLEGRCIQALHVGPYVTEAETLDRMRRVAADLGLAFHGRHHEIRLSDPRRTRPQQLRTLLRQPVRTVR